MIERATPGIPEVMRAESMKITSHGCLSRSVAGIRKRSLIVNLPGSKKAAQENLLAVIQEPYNTQESLFLPIERKDSAHWYRPAGQDTLCH